VWDSAEKIGFIVIVGVLMLVILRSSGELGSRALTVSRPAHFEGEPPDAHGGSDTGHDDAHGGGYGAYARRSNVGRQLLILVVLLVVLLGIVWIGNGSLGIFWY
jgi:hypothetical protein